MNELVILKNKQPVTTSLKIAEVFNKRHKDVLESIRNLGNDLRSAEKSADYFTETTYQDKQNKSRVMYLMNRDAFTLLTMGFNNTGEVLNWKLKYIEAFNQMERQLMNQAPTNMIEALTLALEQAKTIETQKQEIGLLKPKADFFDAVANSKTAIQIGDVAKVLNIRGIGRNKLFEILRKEKILMNDNLPYQTYIDRGYFRVIEQKYNVGAEVRINFKTLVYQRGVNFIRKKVEDHQENVLGK